MDRVLSGSSFCLWAIAAQGGALLYRETNSCLGALLDTRPLVGAHARTTGPRVERDYGVVYGDAVSGAPWFFAMSYSKRIVCLANSRKHSGRCVAGKELTQNPQLGDWVRPVSARPKQELSLAEQRYTNGEEAQLLDVIDIILEQAVPSGHQVENHLVDTAHRWVKVGVLAWHDLDAALDQFNGSLWVDGHSSYNGTNDRIPLAQCAEVGSSLVLMEVENLVLSVALEGLQPKRTVGHAFRSAPKLTR